MKKKMRKHQAPAWRFYVVSVLLCALPALLVGRILSLQVLDSSRGHQFLQKQGAMRAVRSAEIPAYRGVISDRRGEPLAVSTPVISIWANPQVLATSERLPELAQAIGVKLTELKRRIERYRNKQFMYLQRHSIPSSARDVLARGFVGVYGKREYRRFYPAGEAAAQLVGFTNLDDKGITGLELAYDDWLRGVPGRKQYIKDRRGDVVRDIGVLEPARPGRDIQLSIDLRLQYLMQAELQRAVTENKADSGSIVTLDCHTGEVLAMVNVPVYNPNQHKGLKAASMRNRVVTDAYEPGSTMKTLTLVAALESGRYTPDTVVDTSPGRVRVGPKVYPDPRNYGPITVTRILQKSSQVGVTRIALDLGYKPIREVFQRFGIGHQPGTGFPGESAGRLPQHKKWYATDKVSLAFGYGLAASPLQLASAYAAIANRGVQVPVSLLSLAHAPEGKRLISEKVAGQVLEILHAVTADEGTAHRARVPGYPVGGKTGTVFKVMPDGGYSKHDYVALFAGVAPVDNPRLVTVVVINQPRGKSHGGGSVAAPVFARVMAGAMRLLQVPPQNPEVLARVEATARGGAA